jgi:ferredoxin--NADP+ reductase
MTSTIQEPIKLVKYEIPESAVTYKPKEPYLAKVVANERLTEAGTGVDIRNIILDLSGSGIQYIEGQSVGIIPPGVQEDGKPHRVRLYSIASSRTGDDGLSKTVTLCVKRVAFVDPDTGHEVRGVASNYICNAQPGDEIPLIGPSGRTFFLPADDSVDLIMVAAGTGIAPFRAFLHRIYREKQSWGGKVKLFFGARNGMESIYMNRRNEDIGQYMSKDTFEAFRALSHSEEDGTAKMGFVQDRIGENREEIWNIIRKGNFSFYLCGMKAMEQGVMDVFEHLAARDGLNWEEMKTGFKKAGRWNVEVY